MSNKLTEQDLLALGAIFEESLTLPDPNNFEFDPMPDGEYTCQVVSIEITKTKETDKLMAAWRFKVVEGEEGAGRNIFKNSILTDNPKNMRRLLSDAAKFGLVADSLPTLLGQLDSLKDEYCLVQLKTDSQNRQWVSLDVPEV